MCATSLGKLCASDHAMNAIDEMSALNRGSQEIFSMSMAQPTRYGRNWKRKPGGICNEVHRKPFGMWALFAGSFQKQLTAVLGYDAATARAITKKAKPQYRQIIRRLPEFEKADRFKMNLVNCAMIGAFILSMPQRPEVDRLTDYYAKSMMTAPMQWFCRKSGKSKFTAKDIAAMKATAALKAADRNPYSWNMEFYEYPDGSGYEGRFTRCGICVLMKELGLYDLTPALCHLDYTMSEAGGVTDFVRQYTLASGGPCCDCGYKKKG